jgi:hypothetical protein
MTRLEDRQILKRDIAQARADGSRLAPACALAGLDPRTLQRWKTGDGLSVSDRRPDADRPVRPEFHDQYARAREAQAEHFVDEIALIADDGRNDFMERARQKASRARAY